MGLLGGRVVVELQGGMAHKKHAIIGLRAAMLVFLLSSSSMAQPTLQVRCRNLVQPAGTIVAVHVAVYEQFSVVDLTNTLEVAGNKG
eukprot:746477-Hanusia_phi.AAC.1